MMNATVIPVPTAKTARFECECGESIEVEVGEIGERNRPVCECGRAYIVRYLTDGRGMMWAVAAIDDTES
jgi:hypothetical protein